VLLEGVTRLIAPSPGSRLSDGIIRDTKLGWKATPNHRLKVMTGDHHRIREVATDSRGFRRFGDMNSKKLHILVIGDSFTFARDVSRDKTYYSIASEILDAEVFAFGVEGYDSLQEFMVLDEWMDRIRPDVVVWQFCFNDFINNSLELTRASLQSQSRIRQPYMMDDGSIVYENPGDGVLTHVAKCTHSAFLQVTAHLIEGIESRLGKGSSIKSEIELAGRSHEGFQRSVNITSRILRKVAERCGKIPLVVFTTDCHEPFYSAIRGICRSQDTLFAEDIPIRIKARRLEGVNIYASTTKHWNEEGHRICGEALAGAIHEIEVQLQLPHGGTRN
jgi:hypothetical protein